MSIIFDNFLIGTWCTSSHSSCTCSAVPLSAEAPENSCTSLLNGTPPQLPHLLRTRSVHVVFCPFPITDNASLNAPACWHRHPLRLVISGSLKPERYSSAFQAPSRLLFIWRLFGGASVYCTPWHKGLMSPQQVWTYIYSLPAQKEEKKGM
jgi:hypothetical protein